MARSAAARSLVKKHGPQWKRKASAIAEGSKREQFLGSCLKGSGSQFVQAVRDYGVNERDEPIRLSNWFEEILLLIGDFRIAETFTTGVAQCGKTLSHNLLLTFAIAEAGITVLYAFDRQLSRNNQVKMNFWPVIQGADGNGGWLAKSGVKRRGGNVSQNYDLYQLPGAGQAIFPYVSTSSSGKGSGQAVAGSIAVGFSCSLGLFEERSQYATGAADVLKRRLDAGRIPTKPLRTLGTPGSGAGIEADIEAFAERQFIPHAACPKCGPQPLDPYGGLMKPVERVLPNGDRITSYLSVTGRPLEWHHHDPADPVKTAYFGCPKCDREWEREERKTAWYQCIKTGVTLRDYLRSLPEGVPKNRQAASVEITPLLRIEGVNTAADIIEEGLTTANPADWCQQRTGKPYLAVIDAITLEQLKRAIGAPIPDRKPDLIIAGVDQARQDGDHVIINKIWLPDGWEDEPLPAVKEKTIRQCCFYKAVPRSRLAEFLESMGADFGLVDGEPDIPSADLLSKTTCLETADQKTTLRSQYAADERQSGGDKYKYWKIRQKDFQDDVLASFAVIADDGYPLMRLDESFEEWVPIPMAERSPLRHFTSMKRDPETRLWERPEDTKDGAFFAAMFAEAAFSIRLSGYKNNPFKWQQTAEKTAEEVLHDLIH